MHTFEECKVKLEAVRETLTHIAKLSKNDYTVTALTESAIQMCDELIREPGLKESPQDQELQKRYNTLTSMLKRQANDSRNTSGS